jgi:hypothetical protein
MTAPDDWPPDEPDDDRPPAPMFSPVWSGDMRPVPADVPWLWDGYLAPSNITLLTSQWKSGKSTLLSVLLARRTAGGSLAGRALKPGRTAVVCEEHELHWGQRRRTLDFANDVAFFCRPFGGHKPNMREWQGLINSIALLDLDRRIDLVVFDPLAPFLPGRCENHAELMLEALLALDPLLGRAWRCCSCTTRGRGRRWRARRRAAAAPCWAMRTSPPRCTPTPGPARRTAAACCGPGRATPRRRATW